jgi:predicted RNase H-like nuclease (RuvC/YqgF family)
MNSLIAAVGFSIDCPDPTPKAQLDTAPNQCGPRTSSSAAGPNSPAYLLRAGTPAVQTLLGELMENRLANVRSSEHGTALMKGKASVIVLVVCGIVCGGLIYGLVRLRGESEKERQAAQDRINLLQKDLKDTSGKLEEQVQVNSRLDNSLTTRNAELDAISNRLESTKAQLSMTLVKAESDAKAAAEAITQKQVQIKELEGRNEGLNQKMGDLNTAIGELEGQIADTERKLAASEGDREFLLAELKRMQLEKTELEQQFNDLALLRDQIKKLKDELSIASRLEWIRRGLYGPEQKGAEKLQPGFAPPAGQPPVDLDVEIRQDGGARVVAPTNAPPPNP